MVRWYRCAASMERWNPVTPSGWPAKPCCRAQERSRASASARRGSAAQAACKGAVWRASSASCTTKRQTGCQLRSNMMAHNYRSSEAQHAMHQLLCDCRHCRARC